MATTSVGYTQSVVLLTSLWLDEPNGQPAEVTGLTITIKSLPDEQIVLGPTSDGIENPELGRYQYRWLVTSAVGPGRFRVVWEGLNADADPVKVEEDFTVLESTTEALADWLAPEAARRAGLDITNATHHQIITDALMDAIADAEGYLGRPVLPREITRSGVGVRWDYMLGRAVYDIEDDEVQHIVSAIPDLDEDGNETGTYTVTYIAGVDARDDRYRPIRRWIVAAAAYAHPQVLRAVGNNVRLIKSVAADGQSVTWETIHGASEVPTGGVPKMSTMDRWRIRGRQAYTAPGWTPPPRY